MSEPFDPDKYVAKLKAQQAGGSSGTFDPDAYVAKLIAEKPKPQVGAGETFLNKTVDALPLGKRVTEMVAAPFLHYAAKQPGAQLTQEAVQELKYMHDAGLADEAKPAPSLVDTYRDIRKNRTERTDAGSEQHPLASGLGTGTGIALSILAPLPKIAKTEMGSTAAERVLSATLNGGVYGAVNGLANGSADLTRGEFNKAAEDAAGVPGFRQAAEDARDGRYFRSALDVLGAGALGGAGGGAAMGGLVEGIRPLAGAIKKMAIQQGRNVIQGSSDIAAATRRPLSDEAIENAIRQGAIKPLSNTQSTYLRLDKMTEEQGQVYGEIVRKLEAAGVKGPEVKPLAAQLMARYQQEFATTGANKSLANVFSDEAKNLSKIAPEQERVFAVSPKATNAKTPAKVEITSQGTGKLGLSQAEKLKQRLQQQARYDRLNNSPTEESLQEVASTVRQANEDAIAAATQQSGVDPKIADLGKQFVPAKQQFGLLAQARDAAERGAVKAMGRQPVGIKDAILGAATGNPVSAYAMAIGSSILRNRLPSTLATGAYGTSNALQSGAASGSLARYLEMANGAIGGAQPLLPVTEEEKQRALVAALRGQ